MTIEIYLLVWFIAQRLLPRKVKLKTDIVKETSFEHTQVKLQASQKIHFEGSRCIGASELVFSPWISGSVPTACLLWLECHLQSTSAGAVTPAFCKVEYAFLMCKVRKTEQCAVCIIASLWASSAIKEIIKVIKIVRMKVHWIFLLFLFLGAWWSWMLTLVLRF